MDNDIEESSPKRRRISPRLSERGSSQDAPTQQTPQSSPRRNRPSFASPTKASMSRFNPEILERRRSASPPKQPSPTRLPIPTNRNRVIDTGGSSQPPAGTKTQPLVPGSRAQENTDTSDLPRGQQRGGMAAAPRRSLSRPSPRPLPRPAANEEDEELNPFMGRTIRRSQETGVTIPPPPEPELPPSVDDNVVSTPPRGIHSSSPGRPKSSSRPVQSSPLKQPPLRPQDDNAENTFFAKKPQKPKIARNRPGRPKALQERSANVRNLTAFDPLNAKKRKRDGLKEELEKLRRDLGQAERENERIRVMQASGRTPTLWDDDLALDLIRRYLLPDEDASQPAQSRLLAKAALDPLALLPFAGRPAPIVLDRSHEDTTEVKSHHPVPMSAEEELPFLQLFSPFNISSHLTMLPAEDEDRRQQYSIKLASRHVPGLFHARMEVTTDPVKLRILSLKVPALDPAARPELEPFVQKICSGKCNRSMQTNCGIVAWAMAEWLRVAEHRARFWVQLQREMGSKTSLTATARNARSRKHRRGRDDDDSGVDGDFSITTAELFAFIGKQNLDVSIPIPGGSSHGATIRLSWSIGFDWTGEAQSKVSALTSLPGKWHHADEKQVMGKLPSLFQSLVENGEDPNVAARKVVSLLAGED